MKKLFILLLVTVFVSCEFAGRSTANKENVKDSVTSADSLKSPITKLSADELSGLFSEQKTATQVLVQAKGVSLDGNGVYCYFRMKGAKASGFRMRIQYWNEKHAEANLYKFDVDGDIYEYTANRNRSGSGSMQVTEGASFYWYDNSINKKDQAFLEAVSKAKVVKLSLMSKDSNRLVATTTLSSKEKENIGRTFDYYFALNGATIT